MQENAISLSWAQSAQRTRRNPCARIPHSLVIAGTVNSVVDQLLAFRETTGDFGTLYYACHDWQDPALERRSMQLMAEQVLPRVNAAIEDSRTAVRLTGTAPARLLRLSRPARRLSVPE